MARLATNWIKASFMTALLTGAMSTPAAAAAVTSYEPSTLVTALQEAGYKAKLTKDKDGDLRVESASEGNDISIVFSGCKDGKSCDQVELLAFWNCSETIKRCADLHAKWNEGEYFSKTLISGKSIALYRHILFDKAGISNELFIRNFVMFSNDAVNLMAKF